MEEEFEVNLTRPIGEEFKYEGIILKVMKDEYQPLLRGNCDKNCFFYKTNCSSRDRKCTGQCQWAFKKDGIRIHFEKVYTSSEENSLKELYEDMEADYGINCSK